MTNTFSHWRIIGHERIVAALARAVRHDAPSHAYLLTGPSRVGRRTVARAFAAALNCTADQHPCYVCSNCRMTLHEAHPDFIVVERSEDRRLSVEQVRDARGSVDWRPYQGRFKIYLFIDADEMSEAAANALLKTLEEPPPQVVIILTASQQDAVPQTVLSRCQDLAMQLVPSDTIAAGLHNLYEAEPEVAHRLASLSAGRPGWAVEALSSPDLVREREEDIAQAIALSTAGSLGSRLLLAAEACKGENFVASRAACLHILEDMHEWWRDLLVVASGSDVTPIHVDHHDELRQQASKRGQARVVRGLRDIESTASAVERNVTPRLALEALLLRLG